MPERITEQLVRLLDVLTPEAHREWYGMELMEAAGLSSGTLYPLLHRLEADGWLERTREASSDIGGTRRVMYRITGHGVRCADMVLARRAAARRRAHSVVRPGAVTA